MLYNKKTFIIISLFIFIIIGISFYEYMHPKFSKELMELDSMVIEKCKIKQDTKFCNDNGVYDKESYKDFLKYASVNTRKTLDTITLSSEIIQNNLFSVIGFFFPLFIVILVVKSLSSDIKTKFYQSIILRKGYKKYLHSKLSEIFIYSLLYPVSLIIIVLISCFITGFNFNIDSVNKGIAVYSKAIENHYQFYFIIVCIATYLTCLFYGLIAFICYIKENNTIVAIIKSYLLCIVLGIFDYIIGNYIFGKIIKMDVYAGTFNIFGYANFNEINNYLLIFVNLLILLIIPSIYIVCKYRRKDKFYEEIEKQTSKI